MDKQSQQLVRMEIHISHCLFMRAVLEGPVLELSFLLMIVLESLSDEGVTPFETVVLLLHKRSSTSMRFKYDLVLCVPSNGGRIRMHLYIGTISSHWLIFI